MALPGQFSVGDLYLGEYRNGLKVWDQPGGPGTLVYPQLPVRFPFEDLGYGTVPMAYSAQYYLGCGHPSNCLEIYQYYDPYAEENMVLICCPQCSYIQEIYPVSQYYNWIETPIVI